MRDVGEKWRGRPAGRPYIQGDVQNGPGKVRLRESARPLRLPAADTSPKRGGFTLLPVKCSPVGLRSWASPAGFRVATHSKAPLQGLRSRAPPVAEAARRSRGSGRRMQAPRQGAQHDAPTATRPRMRRRRRLRGLSTGGLQAAPTSNGNPGNRPVRGVSRKVARRGQDPALRGAKRGNHSAKRTSMGGRARRQGSPKRGADRAAGAG